MPREAKLVDLAEVNDRDVRQASFPPGGKRVVMCKPWQSLPPPRRIAQPTDDGREREDRSPGFEHRALDSPEFAAREEPPQQTAQEPEEERYGQDRAGPVACGPIPEQV